jgi:hypothetical protein
MWHIKPSSYKQTYPEFSTHTVYQYQTSRSLERSLNLKYSQISQYSTLTRTRHQGCSQSPCLANEIDAAAAADAADNEGWVRLTRSLLDVVCSYICCIGRCVLVLIDRMVLIVCDMPIILHINFPTKIINTNLIAHPPTAALCLPPYRRSQRSGTGAWGTLGAEWLIVEWRRLQNKELLGDVNKTTTMHLPSFSAQDL